MLPHLLVKMGEVGKLSNYNKSMLHLEMYATAQSVAPKINDLTQRKNLPFQRRSDLIDPTDSIDQALME